MKKSLVVMLTVAVAAVYLVCHTFGSHGTPQNGAPVSVEVAAVKPQHSNHAAPAPVAEEAPVAVAPEETPAKGLIILPMNTTFSTRLPSVEDQKLALALNEEFKRVYGKTNGQ